MNKNEKKNRNFKRGISLIVLVITIIVIIILAAAVMLSIDNNNPIENAKKAKLSHNESVYQEELELYALNEYSNENSSFIKEALNVFGGEELKKYISSMLDEDVDKYIIWQGKLVKKDGEKYVYLNGEQVMMFGKLDAERNLIEQEPLTETRLNFAKEFQAKQESITNEKERLIYNGGYITNCVRTDGYTISCGDLKNKLPSNIVIKSYNLSEEKANGYKIGTNDSICYTGSEEILAKTIFFGDVHLGTAAAITDQDSNSIKWAVADKGKNYTIGQIVASDINADGILSTTDLEIFRMNYLNYYNIINQNRPAVMPKF